MNCNKWRVDLWAPTAKVNLGLAKAVTNQQTINVPAHAAAEIRSPRLGTLPFYATPTCSNGHQVLSTDCSGHIDAAGHPADALDRDPEQLGPHRPVADQHARLGTPVSNLVITGTNFTAGPGSPRSASPTPPATTSRWPSEQGPRSSTPSTKITVVSVPAGVIATSTTSGTSACSRAATGPPTTATPRPASRSSRSATRSSTAGPFVTRATSARCGIDRTPPISNPNTLISHNIALGVDHELSTAAGRPVRAELLQRRRRFVTAAVDGQNCLATDTGLPANALEEGMITGINGHLGSPAQAGDVALHARQRDGRRLQPQRRRAELLLHRARPPASAT